MLGWVSSLLNGLRESEAALDRIEQKTEVLMAKLDDFKAEITGANADIDRVVLKIQALLDQLAGGGMTIAEQDEALAQVKGLCGRLDALAPPLGVDPNNP